jgi:hypothetical protein
MAAAVDYHTVVAPQLSVERACRNALQGGIGNLQVEELAVVDRSFVEERQVDRTVVEQEEGGMRHLMDCIDVAPVGIVMAHYILFHRLGRKSWH